MIWVILAALGVPLWLCAVGILTLLLRNRALRKRPGNVPVRVHPPDKKRWSPGHGVWLHDVFALRGLPRRGRRLSFGPPRPRCAHQATKSARNCTVSATRRSS
jgi:hypothetical protein